MGNVVVVGSVNQDLHLRIDALPSPGETVLARALSRSPGGKGANQAAAVARHVGHCAFVGAVGEDEAGEALIGSLDAVGVDTTQIRRLPDATTGTAVVMVDRGGQNSIVVASGANMALTPDQVTASLSELGPVGTVLTQGELSTDCIGAASAFARDRGARFVLNLAPYRRLAQGILESCDPLIVNELEAEALAADVGLIGRDPEVLVTELVRRCRSVIITLGGQGAVYADHERSGHVQAPQIEVVDTTGAGDAFVGATAAALAHGSDLATACRAGVAAGSRAVQHHGAQP